MNDRPTIHEIELGRLTKKLNKIKDQRDKARKDLEYYKKVISMQPYIAKRYESYENRIAEIKRVKDLETRVQEQAKLIDALRPKCYCYNCSDNNTRMTRMILCPECGNKRCPRATDHTNACTNSNEPGQEGSRY